MVEQHCVNGNKVFASEIDDLLLSCLNSEDISIPNTSISNQEISIFQKIQEALAMNDPHDEYLINVILEGFIVSGLFFFYPDQEYIIQRETYARPIYIKE